MIGLLLAFFYSAYLAFNDKAPADIAHSTAHFLVWWYSVWLFVTPILCTTIYTGLIAVGVATDNNELGKLGMLGLLGRLVPNILEVIVCYWGAHLFLAGTGDEWSYTKVYLGLGLMFVTAAGNWWWNTCLNNAANEQK